VADQLARSAARKADEEMRREERRTDREARRAERKADKERQGEGQHAHEAGAQRDTTGENTAGSSSPPESLMMLASLQGSGDQKTRAEEHKDGKLADPTVKSEVCRKNYVSAKDCDEWVADQLARRAARKADEERRWEQRHADEEARWAARKADEEDSGSAPETLMTLAVGADGPGDSQAADAAREKAEWCHREYVSAKDCDKWVADQLARRAARKENDARRHEEQRADDEARRAGNDNDATEMLPTLLFSANEGDDAVAPNAWMQNLTAGQRHALRSKLAWLARKSKKEQSIASQDGGAAVESMRQEYLGKAKNVMADYKKKAAAAAAAAAAKAGESAKEIAKQGSGRWSQASASGGGSGSSSSSGGGSSSSNISNITSVRSSTMSCHRPLDRQIIGPQLALVHPSSHLPEWHPYVCLCLGLCPHPHRLPCPLSHVLVGQA